MKNIIKFCKDRYKLLIPLMVIIVLIVALFFFYKEYKFDNYRNKSDISVFQYFGGIKREYIATVTRNLKGSIINIEPNGIKIMYDATPIYYKDEGKVIFPEMMSIVFPLKEGNQNKLYKYSTYYMDDGRRYINNNISDIECDNFFLYDGKNIFFFPYEVTLNIDKEKIILGDNSTVTIVGNTLVYYNYKEDNSEVIELNDKSATITSENINVNLRERYVIAFGREILLFKPDNLNQLTNN